MANFTVLDWQGKETGESSIDLKTAKESSAADLLHRAVLRRVLVEQGKVQLELLFALGVELFSALSLGNITWK